MFFVTTLTKPNLPCNLPMRRCTRRRLLLVSAPPRRHALREPRNHDGPGRTRNGTFIAINTLHSAFARRSRCSAIRIDYNNGGGRSASESCPGATAVSRGAVSVRSAAPNEGEPARCPARRGSRNGTGIVSGGGPNRQRPAGEFARYAAPWYSPGAALTHCPARRRRAPPAICPGARCCGGRSGKAVSAAPTSAPARPDPDFSTLKTGGRHSVQGGRYASALEH